MNTNFHTLRKAARNYSRQFFPVSILLSAKFNSAYLLIFGLLFFMAAGCSPVKKSGNEQDLNSTADTLSDEQLLDTIQFYTFQFFWDGAEPNSGLARERYHVDGVYPQNDKNIVTSGGGGFGLMAILVGIERGYITRQEGLERYLQIVDFLKHADRFHGVWPHWINGETGKVKPFSKYDDGGDLVETAYLVQGLLTVKQYFIEGNEEEQQLVQKIDSLWRGVEWDWHQKGGEDVLYWHWSPNVGWRMDFPLRGYNECLITYILGASSPTHPISTAAYHEGWARNGEIKGHHEKYGYILPLNHNGSLEQGGPLFWAHYSYLGLDPRNLSDQYANYWENNVAQTMINYQHCIENPQNYKGYGEDCWGLTASYSVPGAAQYFSGQTNEKPEPDSASVDVGYAGHKPGFDLGVIAPTAALSSMPYAPEEAMKALRHFYFDLGNKLMGPYGFYDAFSEEYNWWPQKYLAIDQGPIPVMIENYRTGLLWNLFMKNEEVQKGLKRLGFSYNENSVSGIKTKPNQ